MTRVTKRATLEAPATALGIFDAIRDDMVIPGNAQLVCVDFDEQVSFTSPVSSRALLTFEWEDKS